MKVLLLEQNQADRVEKIELLERERGELRDHIRKKEGEVAETTHSLQAQEHWNRQAEEQVNR